MDLTAVRDESECGDAAAGNVHESSLLRCLAGPILALAFSALLLPTPAAAAAGDLDLDNVDDFHNVARTVFASDV